MPEVVTTRIDREMRRAIKKYRINVSKVVRAALRAEIKRREKAVLREKLAGARALLRRTKQVQ